MTEPITPPELLGRQDEPVIEPLAAWDDPVKGVQVVWFADGEYWQGDVIEVEDGLETINDRPVERE